MVSPSATCSYHASIIASSAAAAVRNGLPKALRECSWPRCRSDQIQVVASGSVHSAASAACALRISALYLAPVHRRVYRRPQRLAQLVEVERGQPLGCRSCCHRLSGVTLRRGGGARRAGVSLSCARSAQRVGLGVGVARRSQAPPRLAVSRRPPGRLRSGHLVLVSRRLFRHRFSSVKGVPPRAIHFNDRTSRSYSRPLGIRTVSGGFPSAMRAHDSMLS